MRIVGINIPDQKRIEVALAYVYGVGLSQSKKILEATRIDPNKRAKNLEPDEVNRIKEYIESHLKIEGELRQNIRENIERLKEIQSYRGMRHAKKLPTRGQRTRTNSRTRRGNVRKTATSGKKKAALK
ncbi:MAG: 30S ribosomal protein S13 [Candidatus Colwellbacteria bacterium]|nr:30S ribosomal protein S13 [Candidatus Colwellbacteria bacterium]